MPYEVLATSQTPAIIVYLLDVSASMYQPLGGKRRIDVVEEALSATLRQMVFRSTKGRKVSPRYKIAMFAYSDKVYKITDEFKTIAEIATDGVPELSPLRTTDTAKGFLAVEQLLKKNAHELRECPAPVICHMTDGEYTGDDPEPIVKRIMEMSVPDGNVLVENIFLSTSILKDDVTDVKNWSGILSDTPLTNEYAEKLRGMSSPIPESYHAMMRENGYRLDKGALMMFPGTRPELVAMGFQMSAATPIR